MSTEALQFREYDGSAISEPGAYLNVPMAQYHGDPCVGPSVSSSGLRAIFIDSPKHYWNGSPYNPDREDIPQTEAIILGRAAHHALLGEADFKGQFVLQPDKYPDGSGKDWSGNSKVCKQWKAEQELEGLTVITAKQIEYVKGMAKSLGEEPLVQGGILNGAVEVSFFWKDEETGIWLKARPDVVPNDSGDVADLKCVADVSDRGIARGLSERGYHQQGALVGEAFRHVWQIEMQHFTLVYVEQKRPHSVRFDEIAPDEIAFGADENRAALRLMRKCLDTGYWPGPKGMHGDGSYVRRLPWATSQAEQRRIAINLETESHMASVRAGAAA